MWSSEIMVRCCPLVGVKNCPDLFLLFIGDSCRQPPQLLTIHPSHLNADFWIFVFLDFYTLWWGTALFPYWAHERMWIPSYFEIWAHKNLTTLCFFFLANMVTLQQKRAHWERGPTLTKLKQPDQESKWCSVSGLPHTVTAQTEKSSEGFEVSFIRLRKTRSVSGCSHIPRKSWNKSLVDA